MSNVLDETTQKQVIALGRLRWSLRRIEAAMGVRRETISGYLKAPRWRRERIGTASLHLGIRVH